MPAFLINGAMLVSAIPHGGHYLIDLIGGGAIALCAILIVRLPLGVRADRLMASRKASLANA